jgi:hypothetical protein
MNADETTPADVVRALKTRGVNDPEELLECGTPAQIIAACHRWDRQHNVRPALLVFWIRNHQFEDPGPSSGPSRGEILRARFDEYARRFPVESAIEPHAQLQARCWSDDPDRCPGSMVVIETTYPLISVECDRCGFVAAYPVRSLAAVWVNYHQPSEEIF